MTSLEKYVIMIPNTIEPYGYELINILAYPSGFVYRFRFGEAWVQEKVQSRLSDLKDKPGFIVLREWETGNLFPIRCCTLKEAKKIGTIYYFEYELNDIIDYDSIEKLRNEQINEYRRKFDNVHSAVISKNPPNDDMAPLVLLSNYNPNIKNENYVGPPIEKEFEQWGNVLSVIENIKLYEDVEFIKLVNIIDMKNEVDKAKFKNGTIRLKEGRDFRVRILQYISKRSEEKPATRDIRILLDDSYIAPIRIEQRAVGKYDVLTYIIRTNPGSGNKRTFIDIEHLAKEEADYSIEPKLHLPVHIIKSSKRFIIRVLLFILVLSLYYAPDLLPEFINIEDRTVKDISLVVLAVVVIDICNDIRSYLSK